MLWILVVSYIALHLLYLLYIQRVDTVEVHSCVDNSEIHL